MGECWGFFGLSFPCVHYLPYLKTWGIRVAKRVILTTHEEAYISLLNHSVYPLLLLFHLLSSKHFTFIQTVSEFLLKTLTVFSQNNIFSLIFCFFILVPSCSNEQVLISALHPMSTSQVLLAGDWRTEEQGGETMCCYGRKEVQVNRRKHGWLGETTHL